MDINEITERYGNYNSTHEVYGVLAEEVAEFFELVKWTTIDLHNPPKHEGDLRSLNSKVRNMIDELTDIRNTCQKAINELEQNKIRFI